MPHRCVHTGDMTTSPSSRHNLMPPAATPADTYGFRPGSYAHTLWTGASTHGMSAHAGDAKTCAECADVRRPVPTRQRRPRPAAGVIAQPWGYEYGCCGGHPDRGHVGYCGA